MNKTPKQFERYFKGMANHNRISILMYLEKNQGASLDEIAQRIRRNPKTVSEHVMRLSKAGLVDKADRTNVVSHKLSPFGRKFLEFLRSF